MKFGDTYIHQAGVFRCCLSLPGSPEDLVAIGDKKNCPHCNEEFTLILRDSLGEAYPSWTPTWQLDKEVK